MLYRGKRSSYTAVTSSIIDSGRYLENRVGLSRLSKSKTTYKGCLYNSTVICA
jgi:hypothetical protein